MDTEYNVKKEARKQYLSYFKVWFIILAVLIVMAAGLYFFKLVLHGGLIRTNNEAPLERVYDNANVLSGKEEEKLRKKIAKAERKIGCDIVLVTINQPVEGVEAQEEYDYRYDIWDYNMRDIADDFYDYNHFGYDKENHSGALLLDNWYEDEYGSQKGSWLCTTGKVLDRFGDYEIDIVLDEVYDWVEINPYKAYCAYIDTVVTLMGGGPSKDVRNGILGAAIIIPLLVAVIYIPVNMRAKEGKVTINASTYVDGNVRINTKRDDFIRKTCTSTRISSDSSSGGGGSRSRSGGGGSHRSSSGSSHGGGGRRR